MGALLPASSCGPTGDVSAGSLYLVTEGRLDLTAGSTSARWEQGNFPKGAREAIPGWSSPSAEPA